jgi:UDP:flavonoid glycosyltransferase YjiC (YdhE family)
MPPSAARWDHRRVRVLVSTTAGSGHLGPLVPFARACEAAGHEVAVAAPASFAAAVAAAGFEHRPFADAPADLMGQTFGRLASLTFEEANRVVASEVFGRLDAQAARPALVRVLGDWRPDVVLREPAELGSLVAAESAGVPHATVAIGVRAMTDWMRPLFVEPLTELDALADLPDGTAYAAMTSAPTFTCVPTVLEGEQPVPASTTGPVHRFRDPALTPRHGALPGPWGDPSHPLVYVSFGSVAAGLGGFADLYPAVLEALADQPVRVLLTTGRGIDPGHLPAVPANSHVEAWWPQADVMPYAAAAVGHGGFGTTMAALAAGVPQVVVPLFSIDQRFNAEHVAATGAGVHLDGGPAAVAALPDALARVLAGTSHRDAARAVADEMAGLPPVTDAVTVLERLASA